MPQEISVPYRVVGEIPAQQPIFAPGGLGRLGYLIFSFVVVTLLSTTAKAIVAYFVS